MPRIEIKPFSELTNDELYKLLKLRQEVFIVEQDCAYLDTDDKDQGSWHLLMWEGDDLIGCARILPEGLSYKDHMAIGRVIVDVSYRRKGLGKVIMNAAILKCREVSSLPIKLSAQVYALDLYSSVGFKATGDTYLEDGIPHQAMVLE